MTVSRRNTRYAGVYIYHSNRSCPETELMKNLAIEKIFPIGKIFVVMAIGYT
jgi:hypothetical protein